jgi:hypothetical protein
MRKRSHYETNEMYACYKCSKELGTNFYRTKSKVVDGIIILTCIFCEYSDKEDCFECRNKNLLCKGCIHGDYGD